VKRLIAFALVLNAALLAARFVQELPALAQEEPTATENGDVNGDGSRDISDAVSLLAWLFQGGPAPVACAQGGGALTPEQAEILSHMSMVEIPVDDLGNTAKTIRFTGVNVQVVNGLGVTNGDPGDPFEDPRTNGTGNLIVGYQELRGPDEAHEDTHRTGSHNLVLGNLNNYTSIGGLVAGIRNTIAGTYCSVTGGVGNTAEGFETSVTGGSNNTSRDNGTTVSGGYGNVAAGYNSSIHGGESNKASGDDASVSGGSHNEASGHWSTVVGGGGREEGQGNQAAGRFSTVTGGQGVIVAEEGGRGP
jgi:hypothetical protein